MKGLSTSPISEVALQVDIIVRYRILSKTRDDRPVWAAGSRLRPSKASGPVAVLVNLGFLVAMLQKIIPFLHSESRASTYKGKDLRCPRRFFSERQGS